MKVQVHPATLTRHLKRMGYAMCLGCSRGVCGRSLPLRVGGGKKGVVAGRCRVLFLDESGFGLWLPLAYSWTAVGTVRGVPRGGGRVGRVNVIGHLDWS